MPTDTPTQPPTSEHVELSEQELLAGLLQNSTDPTTRLLVHISMRQLDLATSIRGLIDAVQDLQGDVDVIRQALSLPPRKRPSLSVVPGE